MTDAELGLNTFIKHDGTGKYIVYLMMTMRTTTMVT